MTFDQALEEYKAARAVLRETQGLLTRAMIEREKLDKDIGQLVKTYKSRYVNLVRAKDALEPELNKEVGSHQDPAKYEEKISKEKEFKRAIDRAAETIDIAPGAGPHEMPALRSQSPVPGTEENNQPAESADRKAEENGTDEGK
jgi:hypothetical protein